MLQYCFQVYLMLHIIIQFNNISIDSCKILPSNAQENETTEVVHASNILPGIAQEHGTTVVGVSNILSHILKGNVQTEVVQAPNISPSNAQEIETTEIKSASKILRDMAQENETIKVLDVSNIMRVIVPENRTAEAIEASHLLPEQTFESLPRSCYDLQKWGGVCENEDRTVIELDPVSGATEIIFELTFNDTKYLPAGALFGLSIRRLVLNDPVATVHENVLEGIVYLREFYVRQSNIKVIPDFRFVKDTIHAIRISSSPLTSLEGKNLQNLTMVKHLFFNKNSIRYIHPVVFKGTENIVLLDLANNVLTSIPPNLLDPMKNLHTFYADHNNLRHVEDIFSITDPEKIYLNSNNITDVGSLLRLDMINVFYLDLSENPIKNITRNSFNGKVDKLLYLNLSHCELENFSSEYFIRLIELENLDLSYNLIEEDSDAYAERFKRLDDLLKVESFSLTGNKLRSLKNILKYKEILDIFASKNKIQYLSDEDFKFVEKTEILELRENEIRRIDTGTFKPIRKSLKDLDLSNNFITSLNGSISYLSQLIKLHLEDNLIQYFARDEFTGLNELTQLYLQHNRIKALWQFQQLSSLRYLNIIYNDIEVLIPDQVSKSLEVMCLAGNPLQCDCRLQPFLLRLHTKDSLETDIDICRHYSHKNSNCPGMCSCRCTIFGNDHFMSVDCSSKNLSVVPQFLRDGFTMKGGKETITSTGHSLLVMKQNIYPWFDLEDRVLGINLENNSLESLEGIQLPPNLIQLYLANNMLRRLPDSILENQVNLKKVSLSGNPWNCDCDALKFKRWLTSPLRHGTIQDIKHIRCGTSDIGEFTLNGSMIWNLTDDDLCPNDVLTVRSQLQSAVTASVGVLTFATLCLTSIILYKKYELNIKVFLYSRGFNFVKEKNIEYDKEFDAFLSFCHRDDKFVIEEIIPVIEERDPNVHLCIHYRHFMAGEYIYDNIIWAVQNSRRTVLILSKNFLDSEWCLMEFRTAHMQSLEDKVHRIIVIKVGDLPKEMDPAIKAYLNSTTYLTWGENNFWNKLLYILPSGSCVRNSLQKV